MAKKKEGIYITQGEKKLVAMRAKVDGILCLAYVKDNKLIAHEPWENINKQMYTGPYLEFYTK